MNTIVPDIDTTLSDLLSTYVLGSDIDFVTVLDTKQPDSDVTNWDRIKRNYISVAEEDDNNLLYNAGDYGSILIKKGTRLTFGLSYIKRNLPQKGEKTPIVTCEYQPFIAQRLAELLRDPKYTKQVESFTGRSQAVLDNNDITVYVWCKALTNPGDNSQQGAWLNLSPFIQNIQTQVNSQLGSFSISLPPLLCEYDKIFGWQVSNAQGFDQGALRDDVVSSGLLLKYDTKSLEGNYSRPNFLFNTILQSNDLVYIRFEKLSVDQELETRLRQVGQKISASDIAGRVYDMIGLIDDVSLSSSPNTASINIAGRDLMKILIEDGSYFFPEQFAQNIFTNENSLLTKRNRAELEAQALSSASYTFKPIDIILKFIFNKFSNIGWVSNSALGGYGDKLSLDKYELKSTILTQKRIQEIVDKLNETFLKEQRQGVWRICDFVFDPQAASRILADNSISQDNGSIINSINRICQRPFVEFWGDTYGDRYNFIIRKPPTDTIGYRGMVYDAVVTEQQSNTKVGKDDKVKQKQKKKAKQRLVPSGRPSTLSSLVIDIDDVDVLGEPQLSYHNEAYAWYRVIPRGLGIVDEASAFLLAPIVPFDEYAEVFGNKTLSLEYNYSPSEFLQDSTFQTEAKYAEAQAFYDLQYLIQSNQYLPFARQGSITLTGNRTIKRGLFIYLKSTKEVFHVDSVAHYRSIDNGSNVRTTTLRVSRGLREPYIKGKVVQFPGGSKTVSYFDIINTEIQNDASINNKEFLKNWKVDRDIFNFFIQRRQWADE